MTDREFSNLLDQANGLVSDLLHECSFKEVNDELVMTYNYLTKAQINLNWANKHFKKR